MKKFTHVIQSFEDDIKRVKPEKFANNAKDKDTATINYFKTWTIVLPGDVAWKDEYIGVSIKRLTAV